MKTIEAIQHFKTQKALAEALHRCSQAAVSQWDAYPPDLRQLEIENITGGELRAEPECDRYRVAAKAA